MAQMLLSAVGGGTAKDYAAEIEALASAVNALQAKLAAAQSAIDVLNSDFASAFNGTEEAITSFPDTTNYTNSTVSHKFVAGKFCMIYLDFRCVMPVFDNNFTGLTMPAPKLNFVSTTCCDVDDPPGGPIFAMINNSGKFYLRGGTAGRHYVGFLFYLIK